jgi:hypothetical protein
MPYRDVLVRVALGLCPFHEVRLEFEVRAGLYGGWCSSCEAITGRWIGYRADPRPGADFRVEPLTR